MMTLRAGMLIPSESVSVAKTSFTSPQREQLFDGLLEDRAASRRDATTRRAPVRRRTSSKRKRAEVVGLDRDRDAISANSRMISLSLGVEVSSIPARTHASTASSQPAREKMKTIAGSMSSRCERLRRPRRASVCAGCRSSTGADAGAADAMPTRRRRSPVPRSGRATGSASVSLPSSSSGWKSRADHHEVAQLDRALAFDDDPRLSPERPEPVAELLDVGHRRGQAHDATSSGEVDQDLLPDGAAVLVLQVVHLVHDDPAQAVERR